MKAQLDASDLVKMLRSNFTGVEELLEYKSAYTEHITQLEKNLNGNEVQPAEIDRVHSMLAEMIEFCRSNKARAITYKEERKLLSPEQKKKDDSFITKK